jgi:hypothetical protein
MVMRLYLDGCSLTYGQGLPREQSLGELFRTHGGYEVTDLSRPGKSNLAIAYDAYQHFYDYDVIVLGWTYSSRFTLKYQDQDLDFYVGSHGLGLDLKPDFLNEAHIQVYKYFYTVFGHPYCDRLSDMLVDNTTVSASQNNKKVLSFSWEQRQVKSTIRYPYIPNTQRLSDGHLNQSGTENLFHYLQNLLQ